ncbi:hypothetical protein HAX54_014478 [Datura stramonium]|uniref:Uncharacterized protein n=1 Tax=Datura stramonium TaxID=4076 RepID=A0ABS8RJA2_DATST|nr:hypothetical protein [Datura stramonium]
MQPPAQTPRPWSQHKSPQSQPQPQPQPQPQQQPLNPQTQPQMQGLPKGLTQPQVPQYQQPPAQVHPSRLSSPTTSPVQTQLLFTTSTANKCATSFTIHGQLRPPAGQPAHAPGETPPFNSQCSFRSRSNQQPGLVPSQGQTPTQSQLYPTAQQAGHSIQQHPVQPNQQPMSQQYSQQHTFPGPLPSQSHQQGHFAHQQPLQSQLHPQGLPNVVPQSLHALDLVQPALSQPQMNPSYGNHTSNEHGSMDQKKLSALESKADLDDEQQKRRKAIDDYRQRASSDIDVNKADATVKPDKDAYDDGSKELDQALANHASPDAANGSIKNLNLEKFT